MVRYRTHEIPYDQIKAVETRREIYGGSVAPVLLQGARLILKDDTPVKLGYVSEANSDPCFPYPEIAHQIAERAGAHGRASRQRAPLGAEEVPRPQAAACSASPRATVDEAQIEALNESHRRWVMRLICLLVGLVVVGIALDIIFPPSSGLPPALTSLTKLVMPADAPRRSEAALSRDVVDCSVDVHLHLLAAAAEVAADDRRARRTAPTSAGRARSSSPGSRPTGTSSLETVGARRDSEAGCELAPVADDGVSP